MFYRCDSARGAGGADHDLERTDRTSAATPPECRGARHRPGERQ